jgi:hypothetical protein
LESQQGQGQGKQEEKSPRRGRNSNGHQARGQALGPVARWSEQAHTPRPVTPVTLAAPGVGEAARVGHEDYRSVSA